jgi:ABC-type Fe3+ transport system substrate-binding protein
VRKAAFILAWAALIALIAAWPFLTMYLPATNEGAAASMNDDWSGVLRLWVCDEMWQPGNGSFVPWLNTCIDRFERRHSGVYVQVSSVPLSVIQGFADGDINPPDMLLFAPGMLGSDENLMPLPPNAELPAFLTDAGEGYAAAVALGGYGWALNKAYLTEAPVDWAALGGASKFAKTTKKNQRAFSWMDAPADGPFASYSKAFLSLMADREISEEAKEPVKAGEGLDLGLTGAPEPTPTPLPRVMKLVHATLPETLPADFRARESVLPDFTSGRTAAALVSQRQMQKLDTLSGAGRAPDWTLEPAPFTDQVAFIAVANLPRTDLAQRQALCVQLIEHLLSDESQKALVRIRAFRTVPGESMYASRAGFGPLERALSIGSVQVAAAFDADFHSEAKRAADDFLRRNGGT